MRIAVAGMLMAVLLPGAALIMGALANQQPERTFKVRRSRFGSREEVSYRTWLRSYLPIPLALAVGLTVVGLAR